MVEYRFTADAVAVAIIAAAREEAEDPVKVASREPYSRARHYALHALADAFPYVNKLMIVRCVGGNEKSAKSYWNDSKARVAKIMMGGPRSGKRAALWWNESAYVRVKAAIFEHLRDVGVRMTDLEVRFSMRDQRLPGRPPATAAILPAAAPSQPVRRLSADPGGYASVAPPIMTAKKRSLYDDLRAAVENTAAATPPPED